MLARVVFGVALGLADPAWAHPHIWIGTVITVVFDNQGRVGALRIGSTYDEVYAPDADGDLTEVETGGYSGVRHEPARGIGQS